DGHDGLARGLAPVRGQPVGRGDPATDPAHDAGHRRRDELLDRHLLPTARRFLRATGVGAQRRRVPDAVTGVDGPGPLFGRDRSGAGPGGVPLGTWLKLPAVESAEIIAHAGFDFVVVDLEHAPLNLETAYRLIGVSAALGVTPLVRVPDHT